ncbi:hypothetical protein CBS101457_004427 [Exobasidium rhododendri]|nr:hypothetical protein CBS101457_004427 [Exobasidium rhododendri]
MDMFEDFVQTSRSAPQLQTGQGGFEQDEGGRNLDPVTALETGFVSSDAYQHDASLPPIFQLGRVQYAFSAPLACLTVSSNLLTMCLYAYPSPSRLAQNAANLPAPPKLVRINLDDPEKTLEAEVPLPPLPRLRNAPPSDPSLLGPHKMFADPSGKHLVLTTRNGDNFYWISGWKRARILPRLKGIVIESIAWRQTGESSQRGGKLHLKGQTSNASTIISTGEILIGTQSGDIFETMLVTQTPHDAEDGDFLDRLARRTAPSGPEVDRYLRHLFRLPERQPITGLCSEIFKTGSPSRAAVVVTTSTRIYEFVGELGKGRSDYDSNEGEDLYEKLFAPYRGDVIPNLRSELPGDLPYSELHLWTPKGKKNARALAWLTGPGIYHGLLTFQDQRVGDSVIDSANLLPYPAMALESQDDQGREETVAEIPLSIALTEFHFILLYRDRIMAISSLDDRVAYEETLPLQPQERIIATAVDVSRKTYWVYTDASIFELVVRQEDRDVWQIYLDRHNHEQALRHVKTTAQRELVLSSQGDQFFQEGRQIQAAQCYAQTFNRTFEEIVLKFIDSTERDALRYYLVMRLERLRKNDLMQRMMLATWLVEIYLAKINELEDVAAAEEASQNVDNYRIEMDLLQDELRQFLSTYRDNLDRKTVFGLIVRHGRMEFMLHFAAIVGEHDRIVRYWIQEEQWDKAISALEDQTLLELYYRFAAILMRHAASQTIKSWIKVEKLDPKRLIPAMLLYKGTEEEPHQVIHYLNHVIGRGVTDAAIHNFLLSLLAQRGKEEEGALLTFINRGSSSPGSPEPYYDLDYALRICTSYGKIEACVRIYAKMNNFESAVDLAVDAGNIDLACSCADAVQGDVTLRKKLWLKIANCIVKDKQDISIAMEFLSKTDLLSIEDILPIFPDFTIIDSFKDEICNALESYSNRIEILKTEMDEATQSAESIRLETQRLAHRFVSVDREQSCGKCQELLLQRQFYVFACGHAFHADCLIAETTRHLPQRTLRRILLLQEQLSTLTNGQVPSLPPAYSTVLSDGKSRRGKEVNLGALNLMGLEKLRELVLPDVIVEAISAGVSVSVAGGRKVLAPLDPFADPTATLRALPKEQIKKPEKDSVDKEQLQSMGGRRREEEEKVEEVRRELDSLVANACMLCDGSIQAINRPFVTDADDLQDWEL